jgi:hypothetical protein
MTLSEYIAQTLLHVALGADSATEALKDTKYHVTRMYGDELNVEFEIDLASPLDMSYTSTSESKVRFTMIVAPKPEPKPDKPKKRRRVVYEDVPEGEDE